ASLATRCVDRAGRAAPRAPRRRLLLLRAGELRRPASHPRRDGGARRHPQLALALHRDARGHVVAAPALHFARVAHEPSAFHPALLPLLRAELDRVLLRDRARLACRTSLDRPRLLHLDE